jgi:hypothetical protein
MKITMKNKEKADITLTQYEKTFKGKPIYEKVVLLGSRITEVDSVIAQAASDNPITLVFEFQLLLPKRRARKQKNSTMKSNGMLGAFFERLAVEIKSKSPDVGRYIPNTLRFVARKWYMKKRYPYYSYNVAILVNKEIFEDASTYSQCTGRLVNMIITSWAAAAGIDYQKSKRTFSEQEFNILVLDNFSDERYEHLLGIHYRLSMFAFVGREKYLLEDDAFSCSVD